MNWRPSNWKGLRDERIYVALKRHNLPATGSIILVEAGADAMLEALKGFATFRLQGKTVITINDFRGQMSWVRTHGWLICIPDEEKKT